MNNGSVLQCCNLSKHFTEAGNHITVLRDVSFTVGRGERIAIMGQSGAGKSTLLHLLGGLDNPSQGEVMLDGQNFSRLSEKQRGILRNNSLGFVYQFHHLLPEFTALENVCMPLLINGAISEKAQAVALEMLKKVGLEQRAAHKPGKLSGGERQRIAFARALVNNPKCVLADEPTGNLDKDNAINIMALSLELNKESGTSFVVVTHEASIAEQMDRVFCLENGQLKEIN